MKKDKTAILVDSCCNVPKSFVERYGMYVIPLKVIYHNKEYLDGVNITAEEVYNSLDEEIPKTSLPSGESIINIFQQIKEDGYQNVIAITLSSGLSGTNNLLHLIASQIEDLNIYIYDTKNISIGAGFHAIQAARNIEKGMSFEELQKELEKDLEHCKMFFVVKTLEYLQKGGRIGLVASVFGSALNLKPIISCNEDGIYYTVAKVRGRKQSIRKTRELALAYAKEHKRYNVGIIHCNASVEAEELRQSIVEDLPNTDVFLMDQATPALGVHAGPGALGICIQIIDE